MSEVPDHLIEKAAKAAAAVDGWELEGAWGWAAWDADDKAPYEAVARAAILAVADELRAEGAKAEREKIADGFDTIAATHSGSMRRCAERAAFIVREGVRDAS